MTTTTDTCWADPLTRAERIELAARLARACEKFWDAAWPRDPRKLMAVPDDLGDFLMRASAEMANLHLDATERAEVAERQDGDDDADRIIERMKLFTGPDDEL